MTPAGRLAGLAAACALVPSAAQAALWALEPSMELSCGANDNYGLAVDRNNQVGTLSVSGVVGASRQTENSATRLDARVTELLLRGDLRQDELQDHFTLGQTLSDALDSYSASVDFARDDTLQTPTSSADLVLGRGLQRTRTGTLGWTRQFTQRLSLSSVLTLQRARYSHQLAGALDYSNTSEAETLQYRLDERDDLDVQATHADYRTLDNAQRSMTDSLTIGATRALSERDRLTIDLGAFRTRTGTRGLVVVCPVDPSLCNAGLVQPVIAIQEARNVRWGLQYDGNWQWQVDEKTAASLVGSRQQAPSGAGVTVRSDTLKASLDRDFNERLHASASYTRSQSVFQGVSLSQQPRLQTLEAVVSRAMTPQWSLRATADYTRSDAPVAGQHADAFSVNVTLRYDWLRLEAHH